MNTYCKVLLSLPWLLLLTFLILHSCAAQASVQAEDERDQEVKLLFLIDRVSWALLAKYALPEVIANDD